MSEPTDAKAGSQAGIPNSPQELMAMQENKPVRPETQERLQSVKGKQVLDLIEQLETNGAEDQEIALGACCA